MSGFHLFFFIFFCCVVLLVVLPGVRWGTVMDVARRMGLIMGGVGSIHSVFNELRLKKKGLQTSVIRMSYQEFADHGNASFCYNVRHNLDPAS
jgi:ABC-type sulfate transport system permease subunit